eukprot:403370128
MEDTEMKDDFDDYSYHTPPDTTPQTYIPTVSTSSLKFYVATVRDSLGVETFIDEPLGSSNHKTIFYMAKVANQGIFTKQIILSQNFNIWQNLSEMIPNPIKFITINTSDLVVNKREKQINVRHFIESNKQKPFSFFRDEINWNEFKHFEQRQHQINLSCIIRQRLFISILKRTCKALEGLQVRFNYDLKKQYLKSIDTIRCSFMKYMTVHALKVQGEFILIQGSIHIDFLYDFQNFRNGEDEYFKRNFPQDCNQQLLTIILNQKNQEFVYESTLSIKGELDCQVEDKLELDFGIYFKQSISLFNKTFKKDMLKVLLQMIQQQKLFQVQNHNSTIFNCKILGEVCEDEQVATIQEEINMSEIYHGFSDKNKELNLRNQGFEELKESELCQDDQQMPNMINNQIRIFALEMNQQLYSLEAKGTIKLVEQFNVNEHDAPVFRMYMQKTKILLSEEFDIDTHPYIIEVTSQTITLWNVRLNIDVTVKSLSSRDYYVFYESQAFVRRNPRTKHLELYVFGYSKQQNRIDIFDIEYLKQFVAQ